MAQDRFVNWKSKGPTRKETRQVLEDFFSEAATKIEWRKDRFFVHLVGTHSNPTKRTKGLSDYPQQPGSPLRPGFRPVIMEINTPSEGRHIEVWLSRTSLDIITRHGDEFTNSLAEGLAKLFARLWQGELEMG